MANLRMFPPTSNVSPFGGPASANMLSDEQLVHHLCNPDLRENALSELVKKRESIEDFGLLLWYSPGTIGALLQEIVSIYQYLSSPNLSHARSNRVCNALALLQCVASHPNTKMLFLQAQIPLYFYPFLNTTRKDKPFEYLRLTSLGVVGALVKLDGTEVVNFLLSSEIIPLCLRTMEVGSELSQTIHVTALLNGSIVIMKVATFIVHKILLDDAGLSYICTTAERFYALTRVLAAMVTAQQFAVLANQPSPKLLKHIIRCYLRLSDNQRACDALGSCLPDVLRNGTFNGCFHDDPLARRWLQQLNENVQSRAAIQAKGAFDHMQSSFDHVYI